MERYIIWSNLDLKLDDWRERVLAEDPSLAGDERRVDSSGALSGHYASGGLGAVAACEI